MQFPPSQSLPTLLNANDLTWYPPSDRFPSDRLPFWTGEDAHGTRWLIKLRGGFNAVRERAFSVIAQALGIACQSSTFLKMSPLPNSLQFPRRGTEFDDVHQLAIWLLDEHSHQHPCNSCALAELKKQFLLRPYEVEVLRTSKIADAINMARGQMLGMLCEMFEPPGCLFTADHAFVQIDNELMFSSDAGADLRDSRWVVDDANQIRSTGLEEAIRLCKQVLSLPDAVFQEAIRMPTGYRPQMKWSVREEIDCIRPRARHFLKWASMQQRGP